MPQATDATYRPERNEAILSATLVPKRKASENWWIASYSALRISDVLSVGSDEAPDSPQAQKLFDDERLDPDAPREIVAGGADIHRFPVVLTRAPFSMVCWSGPETKVSPFPLRRSRMQLAGAATCAAGRVGSLPW